MQLNKTQKQITIENISENIMHIISLLDQNATRTPSPEIVEETSQKNNAVTISPQKDYRLGMHSKNIIDAKLKNLMRVIVLKEIQKTFQMIAIALRQHHQKNKPFKKISNP